MRSSKAAGKRPARDEGPSEEGARPRRMAASAARQRVHRQVEIERSQRRPHREEPRPAPAQPPQEEEPTGIAIPLLSPHAQKRFTTWTHKRKLLGPMMLDEEMLHDWGYWDDITAFLGRSPIRALLTFRDRASWALTAEFLSSFVPLDSIRGGILAPEWSPDTRVSFTLLGSEFTISVGEFAVRMGLYEPEFIETQEYRDLPWTLPEGVTERGFWREHSLDPDFYNPKNAHSRHWRHPHWRILTFVLANNVHGNPDNSNKVLPRDIFLFWSLHTNTPINMGIFMARFFFEQSRGSRASLQAGPFVTRFARSFLFGRVDILADLAPMEESIRLLKSRSLGNMGLKRRPRDVGEEAAEPMMADEPRGDEPRLEGPYFEAPGEEQQHEGPREEFHHEAGPSVRPHEFMDYGRQILELGVRLDTHIGEFRDFRAEFHDFRAQYTEDRATLASMSGLIEDLRRMMAPPPPPPED